MDLLSLLVNRSLVSFVPREADSLLLAVRWFENGMDFGDALHLALSSSVETLLTFDRDFSKRAIRFDAFPEVKLLPTL